MARIYPFRALRYNPAMVAPQDAVTQPYDKITPAMQQAYYQRSPYNLVRIILRMPELFDKEGDLYANAARDFAAWREAGVLAQEGQPCVFAYAQRFAVPGQDGVVRERRGFIALGELCDYSQEVVYRHEQTLSKPKSDRLNLLRATWAHFGQIFMLYSDPAHSAEELLFGRDAAAATLPDIEVTDEYNVLHRVWKLSDPAKINLLATALEDKKLIIADGHHRYETALNYRKERVAGKAAEACERPIAGLPQPAFPEAAAMMTFINMDSEGLVILPTHRVVFGLAGFAASKLLEAARPYFEIEELAGRDGAAATARLASLQGQTAFAAVTAQGWYLLTAKPAAVAETLKHVPARQRQLDVAQLHSLVLEKLMGISAEAIREQTHLRYLRDAAEAVDQVARGDANVAFLMNPVRLEQLREVAFAGEVMPQKSTDFYPKLLSGLAIYALD
ncbi:MAG TPA: DUF1015 domain-containing protein [Acidobacteriaceae bacterium]|jgi:uncharacterized protein (DUF1015 family)|nr:DUF1015 domain-containing protein [Acidobacteriaceae bacterium]